LARIIGKSVGRSNLNKLFENCIFALMKYLYRLNIKQNNFIFVQY